MLDAVAISSPAVSPSSYSLHELWTREACSPIMWIGHFRQVDVEVTPPEITKVTRLITRFRVVLCPL